jgi:hypothetical protein
MPHGNAALQQEGTDLIGGAGEARPRAEHVDYSHCAVSQFFNISCNRWAFLNGATNMAKVRASAPKSTAKPEPEVTVEPAFTANLEAELNKIRDEINAYWRLQCANTKP